ncbi:MAG: 2-oxoglutarate dehydrogenase complex dihydrolipoyllysine-residue succinyltransferase [Desulfobacterales bacterium]
MNIEIKIPSVGESIQEALLAEWFKKDGDRVKKDEPLFVIETDKVTLEIEAEADGILSIKVEAGKTVSIGEVVGTIDTEAEDESKPGKPVKEQKEAETDSGKKPSPEKKAEKDKEPETEDADEDVDKDREKEQVKEISDMEKKDRQLSPAVRKLVSEKKVDIDKISGSGPGGKITKSDVILYLESQEPEKKSPSKDNDDISPEKTLDETADEPIERKPMSPIRRRIAARLLESKQNTAMLTTFNEIDMSRVMEIRSRFKTKFKDTHGIALGFMSFFIKASVAALKEFPEINASIENSDMVYHKYHHIGVAIGTGKGLVVPVIKHADRLGYAAIEQAIVDLVDKIKEKRLDISDMENGTFTITNGGVFGSLLSTPILNYPQSGILGMHKIEKRPVVIDDEIVIRPMMYVALSYDHRIVDGREAVTFLKRIKEFIEDPERMMLEI